MTEQDELTTHEFEENLWNAYNLSGALVPDELLKECQRRLRQAQNSSTANVLMELLEVLDDIHRHRKEKSQSSGRFYSKGDWMFLERVPPTKQMQEKRLRFWALIIGNDRYSGLSALSGCVNDAHLISHYIEEYLGVPRDHIRLLPNATRKTMIDAFYDLRDNEMINPGDNIFIHFSGHGTSYDTRDYFTTFASKVGSIEAICPVDRGPSVPDISERELNSILSELQAAKGGNITAVFDCCHSGGALRSLPTEDAVRYISPLRTHSRGSGPARDLYKMFEAADSHPRRRSTTPPTASETWEANTSCFVQLAACQDFQLARESNFESSTRSDGSELREAVSSIKEVSPRYGRFTWALVKVLQSKMGRTATYASVIASIGGFEDMQVPVAVGSRTNSRLWFRDESD